MGMNRELHSFVKMFVLVFRWASALSKKQKTGQRENLMFDEKYLNKNLEANKPQPSPVSSTVKFFHSKI